MGLMGWEGINRISEVLTDWMGSSEDTETDTDTVDSL